MYFPKLGLADVGHLRPVACDGRLAAGRAPGRMQGERMSALRLLVERDVGERLLVHGRAQKPRGGELERAAFESRVAASLSARLLSPAV